MGYTVLYIAFGIVALWLLGEVLLQYKARLRWRVLAFCGFLGRGRRGRDARRSRDRAGRAGVRRRADPRHPVVQARLLHRLGAGRAARLQPPPQGRCRRAPSRSSRSARSRRTTSRRAPAAAPAAGRAERGRRRRSRSPTLRPPPGDVYQPVPMHEDSGEYPLYDGQPLLHRRPLHQRRLRGLRHAGLPGLGHRAAARGGLVRLPERPATGGWGGRLRRARRRPRSRPPPPRTAAGSRATATTRAATSSPPPATTTARPPATGPRGSAQQPADPYGYGYPYQQEQPQAYIPQQQAPYDPARSRTTSSRSSSRTSSSPTTRSSSRSRTAAAVRRPLRPLPLLTPARPSRPGRRAPGRQRRPSSAGSLAAGGAEPGGGGPGPAWRRPGTAPAARRERRAGEGKCRSSAASS